jgi:pimeloyl-ACP methyl ester carboxylesterase
MIQALWRWLLMAALLAGVVLPSQADEPLKPCRVPGIRNEVQCGAVSRPLNPAEPGGTKIDVHYVVVPALARRKQPDPVFMLAGGPGQSAIKVAPQVMPLFTRLNNRHDIVLVDQRGTGRSAPLECEDVRHLPLAEQADTERQLKDLRECLGRLRKLPYGDLRFFTTTIAMQDLDAVRERLGAQRVDLVGASYGTRAALEYIRQFPKQLRRVVIDGVAPPDMVLPASFSTDNQAAFDAVVAACEAEATCAKAYPSLRADWIALLANLPRPVTVVHPLSGKTESFTLTRDMVLGSVRGPLYSPTLASVLPLAITEAAKGRYEPLLGINSLFGSSKGTALAMGMHFSVVCAEDFPRMARAKDAPGRDFNRDFARVYDRVCAEWPRGEVPEAFYTMAASPAPVLVLSGSIDPATPPRHGERAAKALGASALHVVVPNIGHGVLSAVPCMRDAMYRFIEAEDDAAALKLDASCTRNVPRPPAYRPIELSTETAKK